MPSQASRQYLQILHLAAQESETLVDATLGRILGTDETLSAQRVEALVHESAGSDSLCAAVSVVVAAVDLHEYDSLLPSHQQDEAVLV